MTKIFITIPTSVEKYKMMGTVTNSKNLPYTYVRHGVYSPLESIHQGNFFSL